MPAAINVASCRVAMARSCDETPPNPSAAATSTSRASPVFCSPCTAPASAGRASVRYTPSLRSVWRSTLLLSASRMPRTFLPASVRPVYSNTGTLVHVLLRDGQDFGNRGDALQDFQRAVVHQRAHALRGDGGLLDRAAVDVLQNQLPNLVVDQHHFVNAAAAAVTGVVALLAARGLVEHAAAGVAHLLRREANLFQFLRSGEVRHAAVLAENAHQTLRQHAHQRGSDEERLDAHVDETRDRAGRVVGVDGGEDEVAGERRLNRNFRRLQVADLADHDHVRVLSQKASQTICKRELDLR